MKYYSTRDAAVRMDAAEAIKMGLSRDGGLLTPVRDPPDRPGFFGEPGECPGIRSGRPRSWALYLTDYTYEELLAFAENAYGPEKFDTDAVAPVRTVDDDHPLPGAVARPHQRLQGHGAADAAPAALRRPPQDRGGQDGLHPGGHLRRHRQGCHGGLCRTCRRPRSWCSIPRTACPRSRRPRWSPRRATMWACAPWRATLTTPRPA